jgi:hypothetical protein
MRRHRLDALSLFAGIVFLLVSLVFLDGERSVTELSATWLWGLPVVALGVGSILVGLGRLTTPAATEPESEPGPDSTDEAGKGDDPAPPPAGLTRSADA